MVFSGLVFLFIFLPSVLLVYYLVPFKLKNAVLAIFSLVFYAWGEPVYVLLMLYSVVLNYASALIMESSPNKKQVLVFNVVMNLLILGFFKYCGFLTGIVRDITGADIPELKVALPIGISFYTFQALSYVIDVYRGKVKPQRNIVDFAAYIAMFPQLIAGPIVRYSDISAQLRKRRISLEGFGRGSMRFTFGLAKKALLANLLGETVKMLGTGDLTVLGAWIAAVCFTLQIYFDFSGYSDMAIGLGRMLGFRIGENFDHPYISSSVTEFWRRWHISLGSWFREYVYIPLGGNRVSAAKHIRNIMIVWFLTGLWHGAAWNFIVWGLYYGLLLLFEKYVLSHIKLPKAVALPLTMLFVIIGWVIFSANDMASAFSSIGAMFGAGAAGLTDKLSVLALIESWKLIIVGALFATPLPAMLCKKLTDNEAGKAAVMIYAMALLVLCTAFMSAQSYNPFMYFRF
ncbi:MAG: MBOAT family protein [Lachnospiraceae bacterium]|nr:MBOAT family protein [Lachnospiraceae bacterium]